MMWKQTKWFRKCITNDDIRKIANKSWSNFFHIKVIIRILSRFRNSCSYIYFDVEKIDTNLGYSLVYGVLYLWVCEWVPRVACVSARIGQTRKVFYVYSGFVRRKIRRNRERNGISESRQIRSHISQTLPKLNFKLATFLTVVHFYCPRLAHLIFIFVRWLILFLKLAFEGNFSGIFC